MKTIYMMNFFNFLPDRIQLFRSAKLKTELFYNLVYVATSDGLLHEKEVEILLREAKECGISHATAERILAHTSDLSYDPPKTNEEKNIFLEKLVHIAFADGNLSVRELEIINQKRIELGISKTYLDVLIKTNTRQLLKQA